MKHKIIISAFSCLPHRGSEPGVGWNWAVQAAKTQEVYVLTRTKCKAKIEKELEISPIENIHFIYCDSSERLRKISIYLEYIHWQRKAYLYLKKYVENKKFDYIMHVTFGNIYLPLWIHKINIPFVFGPVGGGEIVPPSMYKRFGIIDRIPHSIKYFLSKTVKYNPVVMGPSKKASLIIARTNETKIIFPQEFQNKIEVKLETCMDTGFLQKIKYEDNNIMSDAINLSYTGRLIAFKNIELIIDSLKNVIEKYPLVKLHIVGEGNQEKYLKKIVEKNNLGDNVIFYGSLDREETLKIVRKSDIYVFPSLREGGTWSLMEAMALGKAIICLNWTGPGIMTDYNSAIKIEMKNYNEMVECFSKSIITLIENKDLRFELGKNAKKRIDDAFNWNKIGVYIEEMLDNLDDK